MILKTLRLATPSLEEGTSDIGSSKGAARGESLPTGSSHLRDTSELGTVLLPRRSGRRMRAENRSTTRLSSCSDVDSGVDAVVLRIKKMKVSLFEKTRGS